MIQCSQEVRLAEMAECLGTMLGLKLASDMCLRKLVAESDCSELVQALHHSSTSPSQFQSIIADCISLQRAFVSCSFTLTRREGNRLLML